MDCASVGCGAWGGKGHAEVVQNIREVGEVDGGGVVEVAGTRNVDAEVVVDGVEHPVTLVGVTQGYQKIRHLVIVEGRYFDPDDMEKEMSAV